MIGIAKGGLFSGLVGGDNGVQVGVNLTPDEIQEINAVLTGIVGPSLAKFLTDVLVGLLNGPLGSLPLKTVLGTVIGLLGSV